MKIGIMTFHWATNYGAILQSFALQQTLLQSKHDVEIIDYKPKQYEPSLWKFIRYRQFLHLNSYISNLKKEKQMSVFRNNFLKCTKRFYSIVELRKQCTSYDVLISGSDQVMNPYFLQCGEKGGSTAYFLDFGKSETKRISYAVSFGTTKYPEHLLPKVSPLIKRFSAISVRESTGKDIMVTMGCNDVIVTPDPTLLLTAEDYDKIINVERKSTEETVVYMLHDRLSYIKNSLPRDNVKIVMSEGIENWLQAIRNCKYLVTNSFHGMVFAILYHVPFSIVLKSTKNEGMNDRFYTLLEYLGLVNCIVSETDFVYTEKVINWHEIDIRLLSLREIGINYINGHIR